MDALIRKIEEASEEELYNIWMAVRARYSELVPDRIMLMVCLDKEKDHSAQIDALTELLIDLRNGMLSCIK